MAFNLFPNPSIFSFSLGPTVIPPTHLTNRQKVGVTFPIHSSQPPSSGFSHPTHSPPSALRRTTNRSSAPVKSNGAMSGTMVHPIDIEMLGNLMEGGHAREQESQSRDSNTPRASRSATPAPENGKEKNLGGNGFDTEFCGSRSGDTDSQYESDTSSIAPIAPPPVRKSQGRVDFAADRGNAIRRVMRANKITKTSTVSHMNT